MGRTIVSVEASFGAGTNDSGLKLLNTAGLQNTFLFIVVRLLSVFPFIFETIYVFHKKGTIACLINSNINSNKILHPDWIIRFSVLILNHVILSDLTSLSSRTLFESREFE